MKGYVWMFFGTLAFLGLDVSSYLDSLRAGHVLFAEIAAGAAGFTLVLSIRYALMIWRQLKW